MSKCNIEYETKKGKEIIIPMSKMRPLEIGVIMYDETYKDTIVMRTQTSYEDGCNFEIMDLTSFEKYCNFDGKENSIEVKLLNATLTVTIHGNLEERE